MTMEESTSTTYPTEIYTTLELSEPPSWTIMPSAVAGGWGVIFNIFSLTYFSRHKRESLGNKLLMLLNVLDLMVCVTQVIISGVMVVYGHVLPWIHETIQMFFFVLLNATGFVTCLLSTTRCISLCVPFYKIREHYLAYAVAAVISYTLLRETIIARVVDREVYDVSPLSQVHMGLLFTEIALMILVVMVTNAISIFRLQFKEKTGRQSRSNSVHATVTVVILSVFFCVLNIIFVTTGFLLFFCKIVLDPTENWELYFGIFYAAPLNSVINPLIYMIRKKDMKNYVFNITKKSCRKLTRILKLTEMVEEEGCVKEGVVKTKVQRTATRGRLMNKNATRNTLLNFN